MKVAKCLIADDIDEVCVQKLTNAGITVDVKTKLKEDALIQEIKTRKYEALIVRSATKVTARVLTECAGILKIVGRAGTGVDNIDVDAASKNGVMVMNTPQGNSISAAELTCYMLMALSRRGPQAYMSMVEGKWERKAFMGTELCGKTLAVIGLGRIGREVATRMQAFQMKTIGFDPLVSKEQAASFNVEKMETLDEIWPRADYITLHVPLIEQTKNMINLDVLSKCKTSVRIVNCARGGIVNEAELLQALKEGKCAGAGLDVFEEEPPKADNPLRKHPLVICTPHLGASTVEAQVRVAEEVADNIIALAQNEMRGVLNTKQLVINKHIEAPIEGAY